MRTAFGTEALVDRFDDLIDQMTCDPKDRHVLAAAVHDHADALVTFNLKDFPPDAAAQHGIEILHPDTFLLQLLHQQPADVVGALQVGVQDLRNPPETLADWLAGLTATVPMFANLTADALRGPLDPVSPIPAMVESDDEAAAAAMGEPGDLTNPAQVAYIWHTGLLHDLGLAQTLTYDPAAWGDYQWAVEHVEGRSLASKVIPAVDAPDRVAFMRFVPEVARTSQVVQPFVTAATFITLIRLDDGTWRVWGLGPVREQCTSLGSDSVAVVEHVGGGIAVRFPTQVGFRDRPGSICVVPGPGRLPWSVRCRCGSFPDLSRVPQPRAPRAPTVCRRKSTSAGRLAMRDEKVSGKPPQPTHTPPRTRDNIDCQTQQVRRTTTRGRGTFGIRSTK